MGWKETLIPDQEVAAQSQSAFAGYGLKSVEVLVNVGIATVAIRFRWIWVEKYVLHEKPEHFLYVAIRFRWIWVEKSDF